MKAWSIALCLLPMPVFAQAGRDTVRMYILDPVTVTATQLEALRSTVPNAVSVVSREDIRRSGETSLLAVINRRVPGLFLTERGVLGYGVSTGAAGGISMRGAGGSPNTQVLVLTDGRPHLQGLMGHPLPDMYVTAGIERVEVIRGPASLLHGTNAMGGVINIISARTPTGGFGSDASASIGGFGTKKVEGGIGFGNEFGGISVHGSRYVTDGHRPYASFRINGGTVRGHLQLSPAFVLSSDASLSGFKTFDPGPASAPRIDNWADILRGSSGFSLENRTGNLQGAVKAYFNFGRHDIYDGFHSTDNSFGVLLYQAMTLSGGTILTAGLDYKRYGGEAENRKTSLAYGKHFVSESALYALVQQPVFSRVTLNGGLRLNQGSIYGNELIPQLGVAYSADGETTLKASVGRGFRSPTIRELYLFPAPTPGLEPERMWNYEVSLLRSFGYRSSVEFTVFQAEGSNLIRTEGMYPNLVLRNSGTFVHRGVEVSGSVGISDQFSIESTYGYLAAGQQTMGNPRHKAFIEGQYQSGIWACNAGVQYIAGLYGADNSIRAMADYALLQARVTVTPVAGLSAYVSGENLTNVSYQTMWDYPMPGRTILTGVRWELQ
jgi:iron complex outermembrane receptor protein